jgi:hypothetical protein
MKKLIFIFLISFFIGCEKEEPTCWVCKVDAITFMKDVQVGELSTFTYPCDIAVEDIFSYEEKHTTVFSVQQLTSGYIVVNDLLVVTQTQCKRR